MKFVYLLKLSESGYYKIGISSNSRNRILQLSTGNPEDINLINIYKTKYYKQIETYLHNIYIHKKIKGEWFNLDIKDELDFIDNCVFCENNLIYIENNKI